MWTKENQREANRKYYRKHRKKRLKKMRAWQIKNPEKQRVYNKKYREKYPERIKAQYKKNYQKRKKHQKKYDKNRYEERLKKLEELLGNKCVVCGYKESKNFKRRRLYFHEIHGKKHSNSRQYIIEHYEDFVVICHSCHKAVHNISKLKVNLKKFLELVKIIKESVSFT